MNVAALTFLGFGPFDVFFGIRFIGFPRAAVVFKLQLIDHHDALIYWTNLRAFVAASAVLKRDVVQSIGCLIEALVWTFKPAESAFRAKIKSHNGPLIFRCAAFKCLIARLALWPQFEMAFDRGNSGPFHELEPLWENGDLMRPLGPFSRFNYPHRLAHFLICFARSFGAGRLFRVFVT